MDNERTGEFHDSEVIELSEGMSFLKCHFFNCDFVGTPGARFKDCIFQDCSTLSGVDVTDCYIGFPKDGTGVNFKLNG